MPAFKSGLLSVIIAGLVVGCIDPQIRSVLGSSTAAVTPAIPHTFPCGDGSMGNPWCVADKEDVKLIKDHSADYFIQTVASIDMGGCSEPFTPIPVFTGSYNGASGEIDNLCSTSSAGFVEHMAVAATLQNIQFSHLTVSGTGIAFTINSVPMHVVGGVAAWIEDSITFDHVVVSSGSVTSTGADATGGLVGVASGWSASVYDCSSAATVSGANLTGGVIGYITDGTSTWNLAASGDVSGNDYVGGLIGSVAAGTGVSDSHSTGNVTANDYAGGLLGQALGVYINNVYATGDVTGNDYIGGLVGTLGDAATLNLGSTYSNQVTGRDHVGGFLGASGGVNTSGSTTQINYSFAETAVSGRNQVGGFVGSATDLVNPEANYLYYSYAKGAVVATGDLIGGFIGESSNGTNATNCFSMGAVSSTAGSFVGGFIGRLDGNGSMANVFSTGAVSTTGDYVGGFVGRIVTGEVNTGFSKGTVSGGAYTGGFVGLNEGAIYTTYSMTTHVTGSTPASRAGFAGSSPGTILWSVYYYDGGVNIPLDPGTVTLYSNLFTPMMNVSNLAAYVGSGFGGDWASRDPTAVPGNSGDITLTPVQSWSCDTNPGAGIAGVAMSTITGFTCY